jgi:hypothetical protein
MRSGKARLVSKVIRIQARPCSAKSVSRAHNSLSGVY